jgi:hypothetical protein
LFFQSLFHWIVKNWSLRLIFLKNMWNFLVKIQKYLNLNASKQPKTSVWQLSLIAPSIVYWYNESSKGEVIDIFYWSVIPKIHSIKS